MKKALIFLLTFSIVIVMTACSNDKQGTYYPDSYEMQNNLESKDYKVSVQTIQNDEYSGTYLIAEKENEYIEFFWLNDSNGINSIKKELETKYSNYSKLVTIEDDKKLGSIIFCSTEKAMADAGIKIVNLKVDVK